MLVEKGYLVEFRNSKISVPSLTLNVETDKERLKATSSSPFCIAAALVYL